ncbi:MAG: FAD-dependent oxidoreductase [Bdellovibrionota bacterium]
MEKNKNASHSIWQTLELPFLSSLSEHQNCDVCVIGAGIAGLSAAYQLLREGKSVVVLERAALGKGETGLTSAHLSSALDDGFAHLRRLHGKAGLALAIDSHVVAINEIERIIKREEISCEFERVNGYLFLEPEDTRETLFEEQRIALEAGMRGVSMLENAPGNFIPTGLCLEFESQAQIHPLKFLLGLSKAILALGGKIYTHTEAKSVKGGKPARVQTDRGFQVICESVIVATNTPFNDWLTMHTKMAAYRTYCVGLRVPTDPAKPALYWDTADPYHYVRRESEPSGSNQDILIVGGEDHRTGQDTQGVDHFKNLQSWAHERLGVRGQMVYSWSGQVLEPHDGLAYIGRNPHDEENVFIVTGDSGHGLTHGVIAGILLRDLILGHENPWEDLYSPSRVSILSLNTFLRETVQSTAPYTDWVDGGDLRSMAEIPKGEGAVLREGLQKIATYKDSFGRCHRYSAVCPHLNGIVRWNSAEKTWDCPCHGSRFDKMGNVINGPAATGLREIADSSVREGESASA